MTNKLTQEQVENIKDDNLDFEYGRLHRIRPEKLRDEDSQSDEFRRNNDRRLYDYVRDTTKKFEKYYKEPDIAQPFYPREVLNPDIPLQKWSDEDILNFPDDYPKDQESIKYKQDQYIQSPTKKDDWQSLDIKQNYIDTKIDPLKGYLKTCQLKESIDFSKGYIQPFYITNEFDNTDIIFKTPENKLIIKTRPQPYILVPILTFDYVDNDYIVYDYVE